jgi:hypothetical protein
MGDGSKMGIKLYPNPTTGSFTLEYKLSETDQAEFCIYSNTAQLIQKIPLDNRSEKITINQLQLLPGTYPYSIRVNGKFVKIDKLIIVK